MAYDDEKDTAQDPENPDPDEQLTADEYNNLVDQILNNEQNKLDATNYQPVTDVDAEVSQAASSVSGLDSAVTDKLDVSGYTPVTDVDAEVSQAASSVSTLDGQVQTLTNEAARRSELFDSAQRVYIAPNGDDSNDGRSLRNAVASFTRAADVIRNARSPGEFNLDPFCVIVESGSYTVDNPVRWPQDASLSGTDLKSVRLYPQNPKLDYFHTDSQQYFEGLRFYDHQWPAFCFSFPRVIVETDVDVQTGELIQADVLYSPEGYLEGDNDAQPAPKVDPPRSESGTQAQVSVTVNNGVVDSITIDDPGSGYETKPIVSIPAPEDKQPFVVASPYPQNCSSITGPYDVNGKEIPPSVPLPYDTENGFSYQGESYAEVDDKGAGGGIIVDGRLCYGRNPMTPISSTSTKPQSPLNSYVTAQFTQVNQGGPGHLLINDGFGQFVSSFTTFSTYSYKTKTGGNALLSNSVTDFGNEGLVAEGRNTDTYTDGDIATDLRSNVANVDVTDGGSGYSSASVTIDAPATGTQATATATISNGKVDSIDVTDSGSGYKTVPNVTISGDGSGAEATAKMDRVGTFTVDNLPTVDQPGSLTTIATPRVGSVVKVGTRDREPFVTNWTDNGDGTYQVTFQPGLLYVDSGEDAKFYEASTINSGAHLFEYPGTGVTYNALPEYGGQPIRSVMTKDYGVGRVFHTSSDERGNFYVGDQFQVDQATGTVTLNTDKFNLAGINALGPFTVNGVEYGVTLREVSDRGGPNATLTSNSGLDGNAVPTVRSVRAWTNGRIQDIEDHLESQITTLSSRVTTNENDISDLQSNKADNPHDNNQHSKTFLINSNGTEYDIQVDGSDGTGIINFKTQ